jgi:glycosyltransferase involved in cell wall biosynthesis
VASSTAPVKEVLSDGETALLVDFFSVADQVSAITRLLDCPELRRGLAAAAQHRARHYDWRRGLHGWRQLLGVDTATTDVGAMASEPTVLYK